MSDKQQILRHFFGHNSFRSGQEEIIDSLINGHDVMAIMPTGAGKSICYQVPALMLPGITLVISPLISLMKDQVASLIQMGIPAAYINSSLEPQQVTKALENAHNGKYKIIYVAPERLQTIDFKRFCDGAKISLIAIDEAHCVSQWGPDFRPSYLKIAEFINSLKTRPVIGAFTATATVEVKKDILNFIQLRGPKIVTTGFDRPNLYFSVIEPDNKDSTLISFLNEKRGKSGIIYCSTRKTVDEVCFLLEQNKFSVTRYHAGLNDFERKSNQDDFVYDRKLIMVATNAFGMGIDKSNVSFVIHYNMPKDIESYYQEAGRAGRDGSDADCILMYSSKDIKTLKYFIEHSNENEELSEKELGIFKKRQYERLRYMTIYCTTSDCLRSYILKYFGAEYSDCCEKCSNCLTRFEFIDVTIDAQKIMSCVIKTGQKYGKRMIVDILRGRSNQKLLNEGLETQSTYGIMSNYTKNEICFIIDGLVRQGYLGCSLDKYSILKVLPKSYDVLHSSKKVLIKMRKELIEQHKDKNLSDIDTKLLCALKDLRKEVSIKSSVPAFVVFSDATLIDMSKKKPITESEFLAVSGVGAVKYERYGKTFIETIKCFKTDV